MSLESRADVRSMVRGGLLTLWTLWALCACTGSPLDPGANQALLTGAPIGLGTVPNAEFRKTIALDAAGSDPAFHSGPAYLVRSDPGFSKVSCIVFSTTNTAAVDSCFIFAHEIAILGPAGEHLGDQIDWPVNGAVGSTLSGFGDSDQTSSCLAAGQSSFFTIGTFVPYDEIGAVSLSIRASDSGTSGAMARPLPIAYSATLNSGLIVSVENRGEVTADMDSATYVMLDTEDIPVGYGLMYKLTPSDGTLKVGDRGRAIESVLLFEGQADKLWVHIDFTDRS